MALQHLRSSTANKRPLPAGMSDAQLAINTNLNSPGVFFKDSNGDLVKVGPAHVGATAPNVSPAAGGQTGNTKGEQWLDTSGTNPVLKIWDGSAWQSEAGEFVNVSGDTMTGALGIIAGSAASPSLFISGDTNTGIYSPGADQVAISTNGTGRLFVGSTGAVTIQNDNFLTWGNNAQGFSGHDSSSNLRFYTSFAERMRLDSSGRLGIGTTSPLYNLESASATDTQLSLTRNAVGRWLLGVTSTNSLTFGKEGASEAARIDSSGRLGLGTSTANGLLHIGTANTRAILLNNSTIGTASTDGTYLSNSTDGSFSIVNQETSSTFQLRETGDTLFTTSGSERLRIDSSGRLLVGTSSSRTVYGGNAVTKLLVETSEDDYDTCLALVHNQNTGANAALRAPVISLSRTRGTSNGSNTVVQSGDALGYIAFEGADGTNIERAAEIKAEVDGTPGANDMPGRLVFSTTADGASSPTERMRIRANGELTTFSSVDAFAPKTAVSAGTSSAIIYGRHSATTVDNGTTSFIVWSNGNVENTNNSYGAISDAKLKENIVDASSQWDDFKALQVRNYNFKEETGQQTHTQIGLVAQEVELVSPGLVSESPDRDEEGNDLGTVTKSVNYSVLYMKAVKALQEAMERIETLEASNADLVARVTALEAQ
jgi:hypothetical protein